MHHQLCKKYIHHIICQHQIEVEIWPSSAEIYFKDERYSDPVNSQVRFDAIVYNAPTDRVSWSVQNINGGPGTGLIDSSGLYTAPVKGSIASGTTEIIIATSIDNSFRKAYAFVTLVGKGPEPKPIPKVEVYPKVMGLYFPTAKDFIDKSNTEQIFRAMVINHDNQHVNWTAKSNPNISSPFSIIPDTDTPSCLLKLNPTSDVLNWIEVKATLTDDPSISDGAIVIPIHYYWPHFIS